MTPRDADEREIDRLAHLWFDTWNASHRALLPPALARTRTLESFKERLRAALPLIRVVGPLHEPLGFTIVRDDELYQLFVSPEAHGTGVGATLLADAERRLAASGVRTAWLACAIGNDRAARFYEKHGWRRAGTMINHAETTEGTFPLETWRYEKVVAP